MGAPEMVGRGLSRRAVIRRSLRAGAYAAPVVLSAVTVRPVGAQVTPPPATATAVPPTVTPVPAVLCMQPVAFSQDLLLFNAAPNVMYNVFATPSNTPGVFNALGSITTDSFGVGEAVFSLALNTSVVTSVTLTVVVAGQPPTNPATTRVSTLVAALACTAGGPRAAASLIGFIVQEPAGGTCTGGAPAYLDFVDAGLFNALSNTAYDLFIRINGTGTPIPVTSVTTNAAGNSTTITQVTVNGAAATSVQLIAVRAGGSPLTPLFSATVGGANLIALGCPAPGAAPGPNRVPEARTLR